VRAHYHRLLPEARPTRPALMTYLAGQGAAGTGAGRATGLRRPSGERRTLLVTEVGGELAALAVDEVLHLTQPVDADAASLQILDIEQVFRGE
jgi:hypothetical protein